MPATSGLAEWLLDLSKHYDTERKSDETVWENCRDVVAGIVTQPWKSGEAEGWRSKTELKHAKAKIYAAFAQILDVFLQGGDIPFMLKKSPYQPDSKGYERDLQEAIDKMVNLIKEQLRDRKADRHTIKKVLSLAYYGLAWSKYNVLPVKKEFFIPTEQDERGVPIAFELEEFENNCPGHEYRSVWSIFTDPEDGDLQKNQGTFDVGQTSPYELRKKIGKRGYIEEAIEEVISEYQKQVDSKGEGLPPKKQKIANRRKGIPHKQFWGRAPTTKVASFIADISAEDFDGSNFTETGRLDEEENIGYETEFMCEMAGDTIIRILPIEEEHRPFKRCYWEELLDEDGGVGIAGNLEGIQNSLIGMVRAFEDNKKLSANVILAIKERYLAPGEGEKVEPGCKLHLTEQCEDARKALQQVIIQDVGESLLSGIDLMLSFGDKIGQIPEIIQGLTLPKHKTDTLGEMNWLMENAGKYLGMVIRNMDESFVEPEINDIYKYNMLYVDGPKVSCSVHATGFSSFQNRTVRQDKIRNLLTLVLSDENLAGEVKIRPHLEEIYRALDIDPDEFLKSEDEKREDAAARAEAEEREKEEIERLAEEEKDRDTEADLAKIEAKGEIKSKQDEEEFQREVILEEISNDRTEE